MGTEYFNCLPRNLRTVTSEKGKSSPREVLAWRQTRDATEMITRRMRAPFLVALCLQTAGSYSIGGSHASLKRARPPQLNVNIRPEQLGSVLEQRRTQLLSELADLTRAIEAEEADQAERTEFFMGVNVTLGSGKSTFEPSFGYLAERRRLHRIGDRRRHKFAEQRDRSRRPQFWPRAAGVTKDAQWYRPRRLWPQQPLLGRGGSAALQARRARLGATTRCGSARRIARRRVAA